jgi:hypothetical protein
MSAGGAITLRTCLSKEMVERDGPPKVRDDGRQKCENSELRRTGKTMSWKVVCSGEQAMTGQGSMTMHSPEAYASSMQMVSQDAKHGPLKMNHSSQGKWLAAECPAKR